MTEILGEVREGNPPGTGSPPRKAESAQRAGSIPAPSPIALDAVTQGARAAWRFTMGAAAAADRAGSLPDAQPKTLRQARAFHHQCAGHYGPPIVRWSRLAWGYAHMLLVKPVLNAAEWITESPARLTVAAVVLAAIWFGR